MKIRFRQEEWLDNKTQICMTRFKAGTVLDNVELKETVFFKTSVPKKTFTAKTPKGEMYFEEWEPGVFERIFEVL